MTDPNDFHAEAMASQNYFPDEIEIPRLYATENVADPMCVIKLFLPVGAATWYFTEYDRDQDLGFGWVDLGNGMPELGYIAVAEIRELRVMGGMVRVERDLYWTPRPLSEVKRLQEGS